MRRFVLLWGLSCTTREIPVTTSFPGEEETGTELVLDECVEALQMQQDDASLSSGSQVFLGESPAFGPSLNASLTLANPCPEKIRFLGHPDDWIDGEGFAISTLPPISIEGGETGTMTLQFTPPERGAYVGTLSIPYTHPASPLTLSLSAAASEALTLVLVGDGRHVATSLDYGQSFELDSFETLVPETNLLQNGICWGNDHFLAVGGEDDRGAWKSPDGIVWMALDVVGAPFRDCAYGKDRFVAISTRLHSSIDGEIWLDGEAESSSTWNSITYGGERFVVVGNDGRIGTTEDGQSWTREHHLNAGSFLKVVYGEERFVAVGTNGAIATSIDGLSWTSAQEGNGSSWTGIAYSSPFFYIGNGSEIFRSGNGRDWTLVAYSNVIPWLAMGSVLFGMSGNTLMVSDDDGVNWSAKKSFDSGLPFRDAVFSGP